MNLTDEDVEEILKFLDRSPYDELKLTTDRFTLELRSGSMPAGMPPAKGATGTGEPIADASNSECGPTSPASAGAVVDIRAPLPGTFYRAPGPGAEPFTDVGETVDEDTILGLVETMKLMNSVVAGCRGEVVEICKHNATAVEAGDVLLRIRVSGNG